MLRIIAAASLAFIAVPASAQTPVAIPCERARMEDLAGKFLDALAARDASRLPLAPTARYTSMPHHSDTGWQR